MFQGIHWSLNGTIIHTLPDDPDLYMAMGNSSEAGLGDNHSFDFEDSFSNIGLGVVTTLNIKSLGSESEGVYSCKNGIESEGISNEVGASVVFVRIR